jgi:heat shock protein HspQ
MARGDSSRAVRGPRIAAAMAKTSIAKFKIGQVIRHREYDLRGVVFDVDAEFRDFAHPAILIEGRQRRDQPFYFLLAENNQNPYMAYLPEQNLLADASGEPVYHPQVEDLFDRDEHGSYRRRDAVMN